MVVNLSIQLLKSFILIEELNMLHHVYTPQNNAIIERFWRSLLNTTRTLIFQSEIPKLFINEALMTACFLLQYRSNPTVKEKTIFECWFNYPSNFGHLHNFDCNCFASVLPVYQQDKL